MIKKSLGMALLSASLLTMAACSSDDDDESDSSTEGTTTEATAGTDTDGTTTDGTETDGTTTDGTTTDGTETDGTTTDGTDTDGTATDGATTGDTTGGDTTLTPGGYIPGTLTALVEANGGLSALTALKEIGLDQALNDPANAWTVFLPTDAALAEFTGTVNLQSHIYLAAPVNAEQATGLSGTSITMNDGFMQPIAGGGTEPLTIGGAAVVTPDLTTEAASTIVHMIDAVLIGN